MSSTPYLMTQAQARELLGQIDVPQILRKLFRDLAAGQAVQPPQQLVVFPKAPGTSSITWVCWLKTRSTGSRPRPTSCASKAHW